MAALDLPSDNAALFFRVREPLARHLGGEHHLCLGGGTALAARWGHRHSTDLDFFIRPDPYARLYQNHLQFERDLAATTGGPGKFAVRPDGAHILLADGSEISLSTPPSFTHDPRSDDTIRGTLVPLETSIEILAKKVGGRILGNNIFLPRDLYDLAVARHYDPGSLDRALRCFTPRHLEQIDAELARLPPDWLINHAQRITTPARLGAARDAVAMVRDILRQARSPTPAR